MTEVTGGPAVVGISVSPMPVFPAFLGGRPAALQILGSKGDFENDYRSDYGDIRLARLDRFSAVSKLVTPEGFPTSQFQTWWRINAEKHETFADIIAQQTINNSAFIEGLKQAQKAAAEATAATQALQAQAAQAANIQRIRDSYSDDHVLSATNTAGSCTVTIFGHQRHYIDPVADVALDGGVINGLAAGTTYYIYYDDTTLAGGAVGYKATTDNAQAVASTANPVRHFVGPIGTPTLTGTGTTGPSAPPPWKFDLPEEPI